YEYKAFFGNIIFNITILLSNMDYDVKELEDSKYSYFKAIDVANSAQELMAILEQYINEVSLAIFSVKNQPDNLNMKRMME
ncbi:DNA-binding response regulator, partial [Alkalihalophilus lindianensis]|nr:DNA-binding response regulator [Alkalihalophilus lindianensis]